MSSQNASGIRGEKHQSEPGTEELAAASPPPEKATRSITGIRWALVVCGVLSVTFLFSLDNSIVADVQPKIIDTFGEIDKLPWLSVAYALGSAATCLVWASVYSSFNAKHSYCVAVFLFEVGSAICGAANSMDLEIFGRALAGLGGIGAYVGVLSLLSALTTPAERPLYIGAIGILWGLGSVLGQVIPPLIPERLANTILALLLEVPSPRAMHRGDGHSISTSLLPAYSSPSTSS